MARAIRASGEWNPKAIRVRSRILVLTDSIEPVGQAVLDRGQDRVAVCHDASLQA